MGAAGLHKSGSPLAGLDPGVALSAFAALFYGLTSIGLVFINKYAFQVFPLTNFVLLLQLVLTVAIFVGQRHLRPAASSSFPLWSPVTARAAAPLAAIYLGNVVFSLLSLKGLNLPMYLVLRRNTPLVVILLKRLVRGTWPTPAVGASVIVVCAGSLVAGYNDLESDVKSYVYAAASCLLQASYMMYIEVRSKGHAHPRDPPPGAASGDAASAAPQPQALSEGEMLHYNALLSLPFVVLICAVTGELSGAGAAAAKAAERASPLGLAAALGGCAGGGLLLNYAMMLCTSTNSALTTTIVGVLKGVVGTVAGFFVLGGAKLTPAGVAGVALNTAGGVAYSYFKWQEKAAAKGGADYARSSGPGGIGGGGEAAHLMETGAARRRRDTDGR